ncbi:MAG: cytochrome P460 [Alphaproteobacteria bacterium]|nr:cytochrome P460 [Alphaproteobacteria bacterium]
MNPSIKTASLALGAIILSGCVAVLAALAQPAANTAPSYTEAGRLVFPSAYRKWVFLSSGHDMSYLPAPVRRMSTFGNVFVSPQSHDAFLQSGTWPDKTVLVLEVRRAEQEGSINRNGHFQSEVVRHEVHLKDVARFSASGGWAFFAFATEAPADMIPRTANCYSCHEANAAVDTTFVQFYPTLLPIARAKNTLSAPYLAAESRN